MTLEVWKDIKGYEGYYQVSNLGEVRAIGHKWQRKGVHKIKLHENNGYGYLMADLHKNNKSKSIAVHRLVAQAFIPNPENKQQVNHKNGDKTDNRVENLEWATAKENIRHAFDNGLNGYSEYRCQRAREASAKPVKCVETGEVFDSLTDAARKYNIDLGNMSGCVNGYKYKRTAGGYHWQLLN